MLRDQALTQVEIAGCIVRKEEVCRGSACPRQTSGAMLSHRLSIVVNCSQAKSSSCQNFHACVGGVVPDDNPVKINQYLDF